MAAEGAGGSDAPAAIGESVARQAPYFAYWDRFSDEFRTAVMEDNRQLVAEMTRYPFVDFQTDHCESAAAGTCPADAGSLTVRTPEEFLAKYDQIINAAVKDAIVNRRLSLGHSDDASAGPADADEYILDVEVMHDQRVFSRAGDGWKMARVPFNS